MSRDAWSNHAGRCVWNCLPRRIGPHLKSCCVCVAFCVASVRKDPATWKRMYDSPEAGVRDVRRLII
eukprot:7441873-Lingulodinium_polyedra.AAC.1